MLPRLFALLALFSLTCALHAQCSTGLGGALTLAAGSHTIDTNTGFIDGALSPAWDGAAFNFTDLTIAAGASVVVTGAQPLRLLATGNVVIDGVLDLSGGNGDPGGSGCNDVNGGVGGAAGAGGGAGGRGGGSAPGTGTPDGEAGFGPGGGGGGVSSGVTNGSAGGGGGGHAMSGQAGMVGVAGASPGAGGSPYASLPPLLGGSGGGGGSVEQDGGTGLGAGDDDAAGGGGGGGAVQVVATGTLVVTGVIDCSGGTGGSADCDGGCGGGGSGGSIELLAGSMPTTMGATLDVSGGSGGVGTAPGGAGSDGRMSIGLSMCAPPCTSRPIPSVAPIRVVGDTSGTGMDQVSAPCGGMADDEVLEYVAPCSGAYTFSLCSGATTFDSVLAVYAADPCQASMLAPLGCSDNACGAQSEVAGVMLAAGATVYIVIDGASPGATGSYELEITATPGCPCPASVIPPTFPISVLGDTSVTSLDLVTPTCAGNSDDEVWQYSVPCDGTYTFSLCTASTLHDTVLEVFDGDPCVAGASSLACSDDGCALQSEVTLPLVAGMDVFVVVDGDAGVTGPYELAVDAVGCPTWWIQSPGCVAPGGTLDVELWNDSAAVQQAGAQWRLFFDPAVFMLDAGFGTGGVQLEPSWTGVSNEVMPGELAMAAWHLPPYPSGMLRHATVRLMHIGGMTTSTIDATCEVWGDPGLADIRPGPFQIAPESIDIGCSVPMPSCSITSPAAGSLLQGSSLVTFDTMHPTSAPLDITYEFNAGAGYLPATRVGGGPSMDLGVAPAAGLTFDWDASADLVAPSFGVVFRVTVSDGMGGMASCQRTFDFDDRPPTCSIATPTMGALLTGSTLVTFDAAYPVMAPLTITYEVDSGSGFQLASRVGGGPSMDTGVTPAAGLSFDWDVAVDVPAPTMGVVFRVTVADPMAGMSSCQVVVDVDTVPPSCAITMPAPGSTLSGAAVMQFDAFSPGAAPLTIAYEFDAGSGFQPASRVAGGSSMDTGVTPGTGLTFSWDVLADVPVMTLGVIFRITVTDALGRARTCEATYDVDPFTCQTLCGDCDENTFGPNILDALEAAQIAVSILVPTMQQSVCCDVDSDTDVDVIDSLLIAQGAAGLPVALVCP